MTDNKIDVQTNLNPDNGIEQVLLFGGKLKLSSRQAGHCKVFVPLAVVLLCALVMWVMVGSALKSGNNINGKFVSSVGDTTDYIQMDSDGEYVKVSGDTKEKGNWFLEGNNLTLKSGEKTVKGRLVERKYIALGDSHFLSGQVSEEIESQTEVTAKDGTVYGFDPNGKFYSKVDGAYMEIGSYIADGYFIIVTTSEGNVTYLNCGDGITSVFYRAV